jgi:hypothetical protein
MKIDWIETKRPHDGVWYPELTPEQTRAQDAWDADVLRAGNAVKTSSGSVSLIGDCNELLGVCDDCTDFSAGDVVAYARVLDWEPER